MLNAAMHADCLSGARVLRHGPCRGAHLHREGDVRPKLAAELLSAWAGEARFLHIGGGGGGGGGQGVHKGCAMVGGSRRLCKAVQHVSREEAACCWAHTWNTCARE